MKKIIFIVCLCLLFTSCGKKEQAELPPVVAQQQELTADSSVDVDLSILSSTMVYAEVNAMMTEPENYVDKLIKMNGTFAVYTDEETSKQYYACVIKDATACCSQGMEFVLAGDKKYPDNYPRIGSNLTVIGRYQLYEENGFYYCHIIDAKIV